MSDYHRFISYIYLYERGLKTMNTGFARVESRDGRCSIDISMKNMYHDPAAVFSVYMFVREGTKLPGIYLGTMETQGSTGSFFTVTDPEHIGNTHWTLEDVCGMMICGSNGKIYGTGWDDEAIRVEKFVPLEGMPEPEIWESATGSPMSEMGNLMPEEEEIEMSESKTSMSEPEPELLMPEQKSEPPLPEQEPEQPILEREAETLIPEQEAEPLMFEYEKNQQSILEKVFEKGQRMYPFEDDQISVCIRMEPQDIGLLPMKYWYLAGNSFVLNGYYSYRHLIMAKEKDGSFIFGIPGVNYERERFMADMFGFCRFKTVKAGVPEENEFGYWCMELKEQF